MVFILPLVLPLAAPSVTQEESPIKHFIFFLRFGTREQSLTVMSFH